MITWKGLEKNNSAWKVVTYNHLDTSKLMS